VTAVDDPPPLPFESRQAPGRYCRDADAEPEAKMKLPGDAARIVEPIFDLDRQLVEALAREDREPVFDHFGEASHDPVDRPREDVHAANDEHVVGPADHPSLELHPRALPRSNLGVVGPARTDEVASAVAEDRSADAAERREDKLG